MTYSDELIADFDDIPDAEAALRQMYREALTEVVRLRDERNQLHRDWSNAVDKRQDLEAQLEERNRLLSIVIDRLPEEEQEIVALRWALSGPFINELPTMTAPAPQEQSQ